MGNSRESSATDVDSTLTWRSDRVRSTPTSDGEKRPALRRRDAAALVAPAVIAFVYGLVVAVTGASVLDTGRPWPGGAVAFGLLGALFVASVWGTVRLLDDAKRVADADVDWSPDARYWVGGGALVLLGLRGVQFAVDGRAVSDPVPVFAGTAVVAAVTASLVAGPLYLLQRRRRC